MVEKHLTPDMDAESNKKMDWFFNDYVYGMQLPAYKLDYGNFGIGPSGDVVLSIKIKQSNVDDKFRMIVPVYLELEDGRISFLGRVRFAGNSSFERKLPLKGLKTKPRRDQLLRRRTRFRKLASSPWAEQRPTLLLLLLLLICGERSF